MSSNAFWSRDFGQRQSAAGGGAQRSRGAAAVVCTALNGLCVIVTSLDVLSPASSSSSSSKAWRDPG